MLTVVTYLWRGSRGYRASHVQQLKDSVACWLTTPHRFLCISDQQIPGVKVIGNPVPQFASRCYRRLWLFSDGARSLGERILHLDLDVVVCGPLDPIVSRGTAFTIYRAGSIAAKGYSLNPSVCTLETGSQTDIWNAFFKAPSRLIRRAKAAGFWGSDQAVISLLREGRDVDTIGDADGIVSYRRMRHEALTRPPEGTRIVSFHGKKSPFDPEVQKAHRWIADAWRPSHAAV